MNKSSRVSNRSSRFLNGSRIPNGCSWVQNESSINRMKYDCPRCAIKCLCELSTPKSCINVYIWARTERLLIAKLVVLFLRINRNDLRQSLLRLQLIKGPLTWFLTREMKWIICFFVILRKEALHWILIFVVILQKPAVLTVPWWADLL